MAPIEDQEQQTLQEPDEIMEEDGHQYFGTKDDGFGGCDIVEEDRSEIQGIQGTSGNDEHKEADGRIPMLPEPSSCLTMPVADVGWGIATAGWILSPVFTRLIDKALSIMEPGESNDNLKKLVTHMIPRLKLTVEAADSGEDKVFFEKLVKKLKSYFYDLEEILDEVEYDRLESQLTGSNKRKHASIDDAGPSNQSSAIESSQKLFKSVKKCLTENLKKIEDALEEARDNIKLEKLLSNRSSAQRRLEVKDRQKTTSRVLRVELIGRDKDLNKITQLLGIDSRATGQSLYGVDPSSRREPLSVIGIYGIAGSGKTTLAQAVYRSEKTANHFELFMWIHVSRNYSVRDIFREMLEQIEYQIRTDMSKYMYFRNRMKTGLDGHEMMREELKEALSTQRFLLVLDDIWCDTDSDKYKLYEIFSLLTQFGERSKILVTSRNKIAISAIGHDVQDATIAIHDLSEKDVFQLLMYHALGVNMTDVIVKESFKAIGAHISKRLKGSPLAAALVGGLLRREMTVDHWMTVNDDPYLLKGIMGILWLCFKHLDEQLRRCFAYCCIFPRRHCFERDDLVQLWVAEGFIEAKNAGKMEEIGNDYFGELVSSSFMLVGEKDSNGGNEYFLVHDLLHDIAEQVGGNDFFRIEYGSRGEVPLDVRHLFVHASCRFFTKDVVKLEKLRSLIIHSGENSLGNEMLLDILENKIRLRKLRVLVVETAYRIPDSQDSYSLPASIGDLKHIRYLAIRWESGRRIYLPDAFNQLYLMQGLDFGDCENLLIACRGLGKLINLRHLMLQGALLGVRRLTRLESLPFFRISTKTGFECRLSELAGFDKLRGKLQIDGLELVKSKDEALSARLADKEGLRELVLNWDYESYFQTKVSQNVQAEVLEGLCPSEHLEELLIINYFGETYPYWMVGNQNRSWRVQRLLLKNCRPLLTQSSPFFANLLRLTFQGCRWNALPDRMEHLKKLTVLIVYRCWQIQSLGELPQSLKYLEVCMCSDTFMDSCNEIHHVERKFIGYPRLQDSSQYPDEHGVLSSDSSMGRLYENKKNDDR